MPLFFRIQPSLPTPAYRQVVDEVRRALRQGTLQPGERLPSIRALARTLAINPNTVARAYRELEHQGVLGSRQGSGFEVCGGPVLEESARGALAGAVREALGVLGPRRTLEVVRQTLKEQEHGKEPRQELR